MQFLEFLASSLVSNLLIILGIGAIILALVRDRAKPALVLSLICTVAYLIVSIYTGKLAPVNFIFFLVGGLFLLLEILIPGFGIFGIIGLVCLAGGISYPASSLASKLTSFSLALVFCIICGIYILKKGFNNGVLKDIILKEAVDEKSQDLSQLVGKEARTLSPLRPTGIVLIDGERYDAMTKGEFIEVDEDVIVKKTEGKKIFVEKRS